jgi:hypothetical protein
MAVEDEALRRAQENQRDALRAKSQGDADERRAEAETAHAVFREARRAAKSLAERGYPRVEVIKIRTDRDGWFSRMKFEELAGWPAYQLHEGYDHQPPIYVYLLSDGRVLGAGDGPKDHGHLFSAHINTKLLAALERLTRGEW